MDLDIKQITQEDGVIDVYGDASFANNKLGIAWVIATQDVENPIENSATSTAPTVIQSRYASLIGEFYAVLKALESIPQDSKIKIHTDNETVLNTVNKILTTGSTTHNGDKVTKQIANKIKETISKHQKVEIEYSHDGITEHRSLQRYYMARAHNVAAEASGAKSAIQLPDPYAPDKKSPKQKRGQHHDGMEIIDSNDTGNPDAYPDPRDTPSPKPNGM